MSFLLMNAYLGDELQILYVNSLFVRGDGLEVGQDFWKPPPPP
jgi:hypothetical protein